MAESDFPPDYLPDFSDEQPYFEDRQLASLKIPPHSIQAEQSVLGGLMLDNETWDKVADRLGEDDFYRRDHQLIFRSIRMLAEKQSPFDVVTLAEVLEKFGWLEDAGGLAYLGTMAKDTPSAANIIAYADIVRERSVLRQLIHAGSEVADAAYHPKGRELISLVEEAEQKIFQIADQRRRTGSGFKPIRTLLASAVTRIDELFNLKGHITGMSTGFTDLDEMTSGLQRSDLIVVAGRPSMGKCLGKGTLVLMYSGELRKVEELQVGDVLMGDDSTPRRILSLARGQENMYWVRQDKGIDYRVNESHILALKRSREEGGHVHGELLTIELREYLQRSDKFKSNYKGFKVGVEFTSQETPIEPYFLGLWLGDGNAIDVRISSQDSEVVAYLADYAERLGLQLSEQKAEGKCPIYGITKGNRGGNQEADNSLQTYLQALNLLGNKHIPQNYLANTTENRLKLLAGLIDSDGYFDTQCGGYEITQSSPDLARQIKFLCDTLGFRTSLTAKQAEIKSIGFESEVYRVRFFGDVERIPVKIPRKQAGSWDCGRSWNQTGITIEFDRFDDYYGFEIDGNGLFLLEDLTVTHNTTFAMNIAENVALENKQPVAVFSMEMPGEQLAMRMMSSLGRIDQHRVRTGKLEDDEWPRMTSAVNMLAETLLFIDDTPALTPTEVRARCRRLAREYGQLGLVVLDYLQLMQVGGGAESRVNEISEISRSLKALAKEMNVPVIALSQLNRNLEQRPNKRPMPSDLRECVTGETLVMLADGRRVPVRELLGKQPEVLAMSEDQKIVRAVSDKVWRVGNKPLLKMSLAGGAILRATAGHRIFTGNGWQTMDAVKVGDRVAMSRRIPQPMPSREWPEYHLVLLGHLVGNGSYLCHQPLRYTTASEENSLAVREAAEAFGCQVNRHAGRGNWHQLVISGNGNRWHPRGVNLWLRQLGIFGQRSHEKHLPPEVFCLPNRQIALLLRHLWATDGCIYTARRAERTASRVYFSTSSERLARDIAALLLRFSIVARIGLVHQCQGRPVWTVDIRSAEQQLRFINDIGTFGPRVVQAEILKSALADKKGNTNVDTLPIEIFGQVRAAMREQGISQRSMAAMRGTAYGGTSHFRFSPSRDTLADYAKLLDSRPLQTASESDLFWDRVVSIEPDGEEEVYDLTVPGPASWLADGIVCHNSGAIEQDADIIIFIYRDEVYNKESSDKGTAEIIIGKQRNGPIGTVRLTFLGQYTRFENFISNPYAEEAGPTLSPDVQYTPEGGGFQLPESPESSDFLPRRK